MEATRAVREAGRAGRPEDALRALAALSRGGVEPDLLAATAAVEACLAAGRADLAQGAFDELFECGGRGGRLVADERAYGVLAGGYGCLCPPLWSSVDLTLERMRRQGLEATAATYNAVLRACMRQGDSERAMGTLDRMEVAGVAPDDQTLEIVRKKRVLRSMVKKRLL